MSKIAKLLLLLLVLLLIGCNRPQEVPNINPTEPPAPKGDTSTPLSTSIDSMSSTNTVAPESSDTPDPGSSPTSGPPLGPTMDMTQALKGDLIPLFPAGTEITLLKITMVDDKVGWGIGIADTKTQHLFHSTDGGIKWQDVTPPQPVITGGGGGGNYTNLEYGVWDGDTAWTAFGGSEFIWATKNAGKTWKPAPVAYETTYGGMFTVLDENQAWFYQFLEGGMQKVFTALNRTSNGGDAWELLLEPHSDISIQSFDKTGSVFITSQYGWLTRDFRGVDPKVRLNLTRDGGFTWESLEIPPPPSLPDIFNHDVAGLYDPYLISPGQGYFRLFTRRFENDQVVDKNFLYKTNNSGKTWDILDIPMGDLYYINDQIMYSISNDIQRSTNGGATWQLVKSVNWDGQFSFIDQNTAWVIASDLTDWENPAYALVKTTDGCKSFAEIKPKLIASSSIR